MCIDACGTFLYSCMFLCYKCELVKNLERDGKQSISREMFVIPLIKAVQELSEKNEALEARILALESS